MIRVRVCGTVLALLVAIAGNAAERQVKSASVESGSEVLVYGHKNWDKGCRALPAPEVRVTRQPANGAVTVRPGMFAVDGALHPDADPGCIGKSFRGTGVYYKSKAGFKGIDEFAYDLTLGHQRPITYGVDARVTVK